MRARLHVLVDEVRGDDLEGPVHVGRDGDRVVAILDAEHADKLARILAMFDTVVDPATLPFEFDGDVWHHAMIDLLRQGALLDLRDLHVPPGVAATMWPDLDLQVVP